MNTKTRHLLGAHCHPHDASDVVANLKINADRYEKLRRLTPVQFQLLYQRNLESGTPFDKLVDKL